MIFFPRGVCPCLLTFFAHVFVKKWELKKLKAAAQKKKIGGKLCVQSKVVRQALLLRAQFFVQIVNVHLFSSSLPRLDTCHETLQIFTWTGQTFVCAWSYFGVIL